MTGILTLAILKRTTTMLLMDFKEFYYKIYGLAILRFN